MKKRTLPGKAAAGTAPVRETGWKKTSAAFPVVGIGVSSGGFDACGALFRNLPIDTGMAFVLVQHAGSKRESALAKLLSRCTSMKVEQARSGARVKPNCVHVIPPDTYMTMHRGMLLLSSRNDGDGPYMPIDHFLRSLAEDAGCRSIGVILSGNGSDGALGMDAIQGAGGITLARDEKTAKLDRMPRAAIAVGSVDLVLPPEGIARALAGVARHRYFLDTDGPVRIQDSDAPALNRIFKQLQDVNAIDFSLYEPTTLKRRLERRMAVHQVDTLERYAELLEHDPAETEAAFREVLIRSTRFFRDPQLYEALQTRVFPGLAERASSENPIRVWAPGCATGEEAYSLAILLLEYLQWKQGAAPIEIFATDISEEAIKKARAGIYPENVAQDVGPDRLGRFFVKHQLGYQVSEGVRTLCVFARQNVATDPPFSKMDLITCCNVLTCLKPAVQKRVVPMFHWALKPGGHLLLDGSETVGPLTGLFKRIDKGHSIYARRQAARTLRLAFEPGAFTGGTLDVGGDRPHSGRDGHIGDASKNADLLAKVGNVEKGVNPGAKAIQGRQVNQLRQELIATRDYLQSVIEDREATNEELQSANEEILASNEELQSINDEMEAAKEELQATNEELTLVNEELENHNLELSQANADLNNLLSIVNIAIVTLGRDLRIRRFTPLAGRILHLIPSDVGRPITDLRTGPRFPDLSQIVGEVLESLTIKECNVETVDGQRYSMSIRPYRSAGNGLDGVVIVLLNKPKTRDEIETGHAYREFIQMLIESAPTPLAVLDSEFRLLQANGAFAKLFQLARVNGVDQILDRVASGAKIFRPLIEDALRRDGSIPVLEAVLSTPSGRVKVSATARAVQPPATPGLVLLSLESVGG